MKISYRAQNIAAMICLSLVVGVSAGAIAWAAYLDTKAVVAITLGSTLMFNVVLAWLNRMDDKRRGGQQ